MNMKAIIAVLLVFSLVATPALAGKKGKHYAPTDECVDAVSQGLLTGSLTGISEAVVTNNDDKPHLVSLVSYEMYAALTIDQIAFKRHKKVLQPGESAKLKVKVPACGYQIDLVCGRALGKMPFYGDRIIDFDFGNQGDWCTPSPKQCKAEVDVTVKEGFPQGNAYVFECNVNQYLTPIAYYWYFGDGEIQPDSQNQNVYHEYQASGEYTVSCSAFDGRHWQTGNLEVVVA